MCFLVICRPAEGGDPAEFPLVQAALITTEIILCTQRAG